MKYRYTYHGSETVHLPTVGITAKGGDTETVYETDEAINHPDFQEVKGGKSEKTKPSTK